MAKRMVRWAAGFIFVVSGMTRGPEPGAPVQVRNLGAVIVNGEDWNMPESTTAKASTGFFSEELAPSYHVNVRALDLTWRQLNPNEGEYRMDLTGSAQDMNFPSMNQQLQSSDPFWMRLWASGEEWAPAWVISDCGITETWEDYDGQFHIPIWNPCVWNHLMDLYRQVFITWNLRADDRMIMLYDPGAFTWCEFDFEIISQAAASGLTFSVFNTWFQAAMPEMVGIFNGENGTPSDDFSHKLVYTGEDYPWGPWDGAANLLARDAVLAGHGIRTGITELFNFHLNHTPAYGATIAQDGHIVTDETWPLLSDGRVIATENECFNDCGYSTSDPWYAVKMANLKALQLRVNWLYVVPGPSYMDMYSYHWEWVRLSLGRRPQDSPDAWVALREFKDVYWQDDDSYSWNGKPWIHNFERWLIQKDLAPDGVSQRGSDVRSQVLDPDNGIAYEGRKTNLASGQTTFYFFVDDLFIAGNAPAVDLKITFLDVGTGQWVLEYMGPLGVVQSQPVIQTASGLVKTVTFRLEDAIFSNSLVNSSDFRIVNTGAHDIEVRFVRLVKVGTALNYQDWPLFHSILDFVRLVGK